MPKHEIFVGEYDIPCTKCGKQTKGKRVLFDVGKLFHADCYFEKKSNANPSVPKPQITPGKAVPAPSRLTNPQQAGAAKLLERGLIKNSVAERLTLARQIVDREFPDMIQTSDYMNLVAETSHQLFAEESMLKIQESKERNIRAIR